MTNGICLLLFLLSIGSIASEVKVTGYLFPAGIFEITSKDVKGVSFYKRKNIIGANKVVVPIESLKTGFALRDEHLHKFLGVKKYKKIEILDIEIKEDTGKGFLHINGVKKQIAFKVEERESDYFCTIKVNWKDFGLKHISFMRVYPKDEVLIEVTFLKKQIY